MFNLINNFLDLGKRARQDDDGIQPTPKRLKFGDNSCNDKRVVLPTEILNKIATYLESPRDVINLFGVHRISFDAPVSESGNALKFEFKERGLYHGQPISIAAAKTRFKTEAKLQYDKVQRLCRLNTNIGKPPFVVVASNIAIFRTIEDWIYSTNLEIIKRAINNHIENNDTTLVLSSKGLSYFPLATLLEDQKIADYLLNITSLHLHQNQLKGAIPAELGQLTRLSELYLNNNQLSGCIPTELKQLTGLSYLQLSNNQLSGSIPTELGQLTGLRYLYLGNNQLSGTIPAEIGRLNNLIYLFINHNQLSGTIPAELGRLSNLSYLLLHNNQLSGAIPVELVQITGLLWLNLSNNQLSGSILAELGQLTNLKFLSLQSNQLSGAIPTELERLTYLSWLYLNNNQLSGSVPDRLLRRFGNNASFANQRNNQPEIDGKKINRI